MGSISVTELEQPRISGIESVGGSEWKQTAANRYERPLDGSEAFFRSIHSLGAQHGRQQWVLSTGVKIRTCRATFAEDLKAVWVALRYRHPILATELDDNKLVYQTADGSELERWLEETFIVHPSNISGAELYGTTPRPLKRVVCNVLPHTQEIVIQGTHAHLDGLGAVTLVNNLLHMLSKRSSSLVVFGDEAKNLLPQFSNIAQIPLATPEQQARWDASLKTWVNAVPTLRLAATNTSSIPGRSRMASLIFTEASTGSIITASRKLALTVTHAAQAAIALASRTHGGDTEHTTFPVFAIYNAREYCTKTCPDASSLVGPHLVGTPIAIALGSFLSTAQSARQHFVSDRVGRYALTMWPTFATVMPQLLAAPQAVPPSAPMLSSFGNLDGRLQRFYGEKGAGKGGGVEEKGIEVEDFWCTLDEATPNFYVGMWTFRGRLRLQVGYNEVYHERESVERWLGLVKEELEGGLGVALEVES